MKTAGLDVTINKLKLTRERRLEKHVLEDDDGTLVMSVFNKIEGFVASDKYEEIERRLNQHFKRCLIDAENSGEEKGQNLVTFIYLNVKVFLWVVV